MNSLVKNTPGAGAPFVNATDLMDEIKAVKSPKKLIKKALAVQDEAMAYARTIIKPGRKDFEIVDDVIHKATLPGSEEYSSSWAA